MVLLLISLSAVLLATWLLTVWGRGATALLEKWTRDRADATHRS